MDFRIKYPDTKITWKNTKGYTHSNRNLIILFDIITYNDRQYLSAINWVQFIDQFLGYSPPGGDTIKEILNEVDIQSINMPFYVDDENKHNEHLRLIECFFDTTKELIDTMSIPLHSGSKKRLINTYTCTGHGFTDCI